MTGDKDDIERFGPEGSTRIVKRGRPKEGEEPEVRMGHLTVSIDPRDRDALRRLSQRDNVPMSTMVQGAVRDIIEKPENRAYLEALEKLNKSRRG